MEKEKRALNNPAGSEQSVGSMLLLIMLCIIVVVTTMVVIGAYYDYKASNLRVETIVSRIEERIIDEKRQGDFQEKNESFVELLKEMSKGAAQPGNITFMFTVFSVALVSGGAYLLERFDRKVKMAEDMVRRLQQKSEDAEKTAKRAKEEADNAFERSETIRRISKFLPRAASISRRLCGLRDAEFCERVSYLRDLTRWAEDDVGYLVKKGERLMDEQCSRFRVCVCEVRSNLEALPEDRQGQVRDNIERCNRIIELLKELCYRE